MLKPYGVEILSAGELGLPPPEETGTTFEAMPRSRLWPPRAPAAAGAGRRFRPECVRARRPAWRLHRRLGRPDARRDGRHAAHPGRARQARRARHRRPRARATFHCVLALAWPDEHLELLHGTLDGRIVWPPRGSGGHGYDPCFQPIGEKRTTAEMADDEKNAISHRGRAFPSWSRPAFDERARLPLGRLHPLAVLQVEVPLLRLQQPRARRRRAGRWRKALLKELEHAAREAPAAGSRRSSSAAARRR